MSNLQRAIDWYRIGGKPFPCYEVDTWVGDILHERKSPRTARGFYDAFDNEDDIRAYWTENPKHLVGIWCGPLIVVLDIDKKYKFDPVTGEEIAIDGQFHLDQNNVDVPPTFSVQTDGGGEHRFYRNPGVENLNGDVDIALANGVVLKGVDRRAGNSYFIAWSDSVPENLQDLPIAPDWLLVATRRAKLAEYSKHGRIWLEECPKGDPDERVRKTIKRIPTTEFNHKKMCGMQYALVKLATEGHSGVPEALWLLREAWLRHPWNEPKWVIRWNAALAGAIRKFGSFDRGESKAVDRIIPNWLTGFAAEEFPESLPPELNDTDLATWLADGCFDRNICFSDKLGWHKWTGTFWEPVSSREIRRDVSDYFKQLAGRLKTEGYRPDALTRLKAKMSSASIKGLINQLESEVFVRMEFFNQNPDVFNVANGELDLRTGELHPHDKRNGHRTIVPVPYHRDFEHSDWIEALTALDPEVAEWFQVAVGQGITGYSPLDDKANFLIGIKAQNGKSTIVLGLLSAFGGYAVLVSEKVLAGNKFDHPTEKMQLFGARIAVLEELPQTAINSKQLKDLTGRMMNARYMRMDTVSWISTHTVFVTSNHPIEVEYLENAISRRIRIFPFDKEFVNEPMHPDQRKKQPDLRERILQGADGQHEAILAWAVKGAVAWYQQGRKMPPEPTQLAQAHEEWQYESDHFARFFEEYLEPSPARFVATVELLAALNHYLSVRGLPTWTEKQLKSTFESSRELLKMRTKVARTRNADSRSIPALADKNFIPTKSAQPVCWFGMKFRSEMAEDDSAGGLF